LTGLLAHIAETAIPLVVLGVFGFFLWRSSRKEQDESNRSRDPRE
jgi:preprotein translocase subunit YajC